MTDRWKQKIQTDGRAWIAQLSVFAYERENPSLKETKLAIWYFSQTDLHAGHTALLPTNLANCHITCRFYGNPTVYKPRIETSDLCSSEHSKLCFQLLQMN